MAVPAAVRAGDRARILDLRGRARREAGRRADRPVRAAMSAAETLREARADDVAGMHRVRPLVRENPLRAAIVAEADYLPYLHDQARGSVIETDGGVRGFAIGGRRDGNGWALACQRGGGGRG